MENGLFWHYFNTKQGYLNGLSDIPPYRQHDTWLPTSFGTIFLGNYLSKKVFFMENGLFCGFWGISMLKSCKISLFECTLGYDTKIQSLGVLGMFWTIWTNIITRHTGKILRNYQRWWLKMTYFWVFLGYTVLFEWLWEHTNVVTTIHHQTVSLTIGWPFKIIKNGCFWVFWHQPPSPECLSCSLGPFKIIKNGCFWVYFGCPLKKPGLGYKRLCLKGTTMVKTPLWVCQKV
jgi:hypothetical protein